MSARRAMVGWRSGLRGVVSLAVGVGLGALGGCGGGPLPPPHYESSQIALGSADSDGNWAPLSDGQDVDLVAGAQGGFHVWMKIRTTGMAQQHVTIAKTAHKLSTGQLVLRSSATADIAPAGAAGTWEIPMPFPMFMCPSPVGIRIIDTPISYEIGLTDETGRDLGKTSITLTPHCPAAQKDFCQRICTG